MKPLDLNKTHTHNGISHSECFVNEWNMPNAFSLQKSWQVIENNQPWQPQATYGKKLVLPSVWVFR